MCLENLIPGLEAIRVPILSEFDEAEVVTKAKGLGQNHYTRENFHRVTEHYSKMWHHHFELLMLGYSAYMVFFNFCKKSFPETADGPWRLRAKEGFKSSLVQ